LFAPILGLVRIVAGVEAVRVDLTDGRVCTYTGLSDSPTGAFRYGLSRHSGIPGVRFEVPPNQNLRRAVDLATGVPLRGTVRLGVKYKLDSSILEARSFNDLDQLTNVSENHRRETTFPSLDLSINRLERLRIFRGAVTSSNLTFGYSKSKTESYSLNGQPGRPVGQPSALNESGRSNLTANWAGQWRHGISSSLNLTQTTTTQGAPSPREGIQRAVTGTVRFRVAPKGGLRLPFLGSRGVLKSGMDVSLTGGYTTNVSTFTANPAAGPQTDGRTSSIQVGARGDYTLSRNISGGVDLGFTRNTDALAKRSITAVRVGVTLSLTF
jgi:hypothetical protein